MDNAVIQWNTARKLTDLLPKMKFLENYAGVNKEVYEDYHKLKNYVDRYHRDLTTYENRFGMKEHYHDFIKFLNNVEKVQDMVESDQSSEDVVDFVKSVGLPGITGGFAVNRDMLNLAEDILTYTEPLVLLFNEMEILTETRKDYQQDISLELSMQLNDVITWKKAKYENRANIQDEKGEEGRGDDEGGVEGVSGQVEQPKLLLEE